MTNLYDKDVWEAKCRGRIILVSEVGSRAFGFDTAESDSDRYGVYVAPTRKIHSLRGLPKETYDWKDDRGDVVLHEVGKICKLAARGNPTILNILFSDPFIEQTPEGIYLASIRDSFLSKAAIMPFLGYAESQLKRFQKGMSVHSKGGKPSGKWAVHFFRLVWQGIHLAKTGKIILRFDDDRVNFLRSLRMGNDLEAVKRDGPGIVEEIRRYVNGDTEINLPDEINERAIDCFLMDMREYPGGFIE